MRAIVEEVRRTLNIHGYKHMKIIVSGGLDEEKIMELRDVADGFGVGTAIARPKNIDISADIVEKLVDGKRVPISKRGKLPGAKNIYVKGPERRVGLLNEAEEYEKKGYKGLMVKRMENGKLIREYPSDEEIRKYVLEQIKKLEL
jgi:nicotinate phosphoribosyltransferase